MLFNFNKSVSGSLCRCAARTRAALRAQLESLPSYRWSRRQHGNGGAGRRWRSTRFAMCLLFLPFALPLFFFLQYCMYSTIENYCSVLVHMYLYTVLYSALSIYRRCHHFARRVSCSSSTSAPSESASLPHLSRRVRAARHVAHSARRRRLRLRHCHRLHQPAGAVCERSQSSSSTRTF